MPTTPAAGAIAGLAAVAGETLLDVLCALRHTNGA
jgi:hypothetical protein